jgi:acetolactate synthase-1/2/3 large subunit
LSSDVQETSTASQVLVRGLAAQGVTHIFGIPGGKIMPAFDALNDSPQGLQLIVCRHEQNAAFMAAAVGRLTGRPGVCMVTSGPGTSNLVTGSATATSEGDPMVAIGGVVPTADTLKQVHQTMDSVSVMKPVTKYSAAIPTAGATGEILANAFRVAMTPRPGAAFIAFPLDVQGASTHERELARVEVPSLGVAPADLIARTAAKLASARQPVLLLGMGASEPKAVTAVRQLLRTFPIAAVGTFQGAGAVSRELSSMFFGRVGLFRNQPGDKLLAHADLILTIGYDPVEYGPESWNIARRAPIIHLDDTPCELSNYYQPEIELRGSVGATIDELTKHLAPRKLLLNEEMRTLQTEWQALQRRSEPKAETLVHPLNFVHTLRNLLDDDTIIASDMGSHHIWMARHFVEYEPRKLLFSNGQQTLGVGIPWAMAASFLYPGKKVVATVGDGGFLYSSMELETAVRNKLNMTVFVFRDGSYNMVAFQQEVQFGRTSGVSFGNPDLVRYVDSLGCTGMRVENAGQLTSIMRKALETPGVVVVDVPVDYSHNIEIEQHVLPNAWN